MISSKLHSKPVFRVRDRSGKPGGLSSGRVFADSPTRLLLSAAMRSEGMNRGTPKTNSPGFEGIGNATSRTSPKLS